MSVPAVDVPPSDFDQLYSELGPAIYARCRQILRDPAAAEDATQEVFLRVHDQLPRLPKRRDAFAWLYRAATNHCLNEVRNGRTRAALIRAVPTDAGPDAEQRISQQDLVIRVVRELPGDLALAAWLYHVDGLDQAEIAELCGISRRTVIARLNRFSELARRFLQKEQG